jgi:hypothetical protein
MSECRPGDRTRDGAKGGEAFMGAAIDIWIALVLTIITSRVEPT